VPAISFVWCRPAFRVIFRQRCAIDSARALTTLARPEYF
jgi:hypothetical protein